jgi:PHP family Zn ribbon phosphoesterase
VPTQVVPKLLVYGPLGIICVVLLYAVIALFKAKEKQAKEAAAALEKLRKEYQDEINSLIETHKEEQNTLMQRHISKAETWVEKGNELANNLQAVLDSIIRRRD